MGPHMKGPRRLETTLMLTYSTMLGLRPLSSTLPNMLQHKKTPRSLEIVCIQWNLQSEDGYLFLLNAEAMDPFSRTVMLPQAVSAN